MYYILHTICTLFSAEGHRNYPLRESKSLRKYSILFFHIHISNIIYHIFHIILPSYIKYYSSNIEYYYISNIIHHFTYTILYQIISHEILS